MRASFVDLHCDTLLTLRQEHCGLENAPGHINLKKLQQGGALLQCLAIFVPDHEDAVKYGITENGALLWDDENYYLLAFDTGTGTIRHYRVDKMAQISACETFRDGKEAFARLDMSAYSKTVFGMFAGEAETVRLRFSNRLAGAVIDRFGRDVMLIREDDEHFSVTISAVVSPQFYAWVFGFGAEAEILSPAHVRKGMADMAREVTEKYGK